MTDLEKRKVNLRFVYSFCKDVGEVRKFYTDLLGMSEIGFMDDGQFGWVGYDSEGVQFMFFKWDEELPSREAWDWQPGDGAGDAPGMSISIEVPEEWCRELIAGLQEAGIRSMTDSPTWRQKSYWGWTVKDPAGNTVEVYWSPAETPDDEEPVWEDL